MNRASQHTLLDGEYDVSDGSQGLPTTSVAGEEVNLVMGAMTLIVPRHIVLHETRHAKLAKPRGEPPTANTGRENVGREVTTVEPKPCGYHSRLSRLWLTACLLLAACSFAASSMVPSAHLSRPDVVSAAVSFQAVPPKKSIATTTRPIEQIKVGEWVIANNPTDEEDLSLGEEVDSATWKRIELRALKHDGSFADVTLLRPDWWLDVHEAHVGESVYISVPECGIDGNAQLLRADPCPQIQARPHENARVVTGTFKHQSAHVIDISVEGIPEPIGTTTNHPFWSEDRHEFVRADELRTGERLQAFTGTPRVVALLPRSEPESVYNLEVQLVHTYHVASNGVLVHNGVLCANLGQKLEYILGNATGSLHNIQRSLAMLKQIKRIGLGNNALTRALLTKHLGEVLNNANNIVRIQNNGRVVRESLLMGPLGGAKLKTIWEGNKLITIGIFGGG